jgi:hypothetical protein
MISPYFTRQGFVSLETLPKTEQFNSTFFAETIFPNVVQGHCMYVDKATPHDSALSLKKTEELGLTDWPTRLIPLIWHPMTSSYSIT